MKCNWRRWLWGVVPLLILCWGAVQVERGHVEEELTERARQALAHAGLSWAAPAFEGRDGVIRGTAWDESEASKAVDAVRSVWGVRSVESNAELVEKAEKYVWSASRHNNRVRILGYAPSTATRKAILGVTKANFPGFEVVDRMTLARGVPSPDTWLAGVSFGLNQLASLKRGEVRLDDLALTVTGEAEDVTGYRAVKTALASNVPKGIKLSADAVMAPVVSPYMWSLERGEGRLLLGGYVPSEAARAELLAAARDAASGAIVTDQMQPGEGAPQGWLAAAQATVRGLLRLESGAAEIRDLALNVSGVAADETRAAAARNGAIKGALISTRESTGSSWRRSTSASSTIRRSTPSTSRCRTHCTPSGPSARCRPASRCCARSRCAARSRKPSACWRGRDTGTLLWEAFVFPFHPQFSKVTGLLADGAIGELREIQSNFHFNVGLPDNIRLFRDLDGGALNDVGCYPVRLALELFGAGHQSAWAVAEWGGQDVDTETRGSLGFAGGRRLLLSCSMRRSYDTFTSLQGTGGQIHLSNPFHPGPGDRFEVLAAGAEAQSYPAAGDEPSFTAAIRHIQAVLRGEEAPRQLATEVSLASALALHDLHASMAAGEACGPAARSVSAGRIVNASACSGRIARKCRSSRVSTRVVPYFSASTTIDASAMPMRRSA